MTDHEYYTRRLRMLEWAVQRLMDVVAVTATPEQLRMFDLMGENLNKAMDELMAEMEAGGT